MKWFFKIFLFLFFNYILLFLFEYILKIKYSELYISKPSYIINLKNRQFDYVVGGSSRVHNNFNTLLFDSVVKKNGFNIGFEGSTLVENYLTLYLFLKNNNKTKAYLLQLEDRTLSYKNSIENKTFHNYLFLPYLGDWQVDEAFKNSVPLYKFMLWKYIPFFKYAEYNKYYSVKKIIRPAKPEKWLIENKGYEELQKDCKEGFPHKEYKSITDPISVDSVNLYYLDKIRLLCKTSQIDLILYSSPIYLKSYQSYTSQNLHSELLKYVNKYQLLYCNFMTDPLFAADSLYLDEVHLNAKGTDIFTAHLAHHLKNSLK